jgi:hypothetical protein
LQDTGRRREGLEMEDDEKAPILQIAEDVYRWKETSKLSIRLSQVMADLLTEVNHFCEANHLEISNGMDSLMGDAGKLFAAIKETQNLPLSELLKRPSGAIHQKLTEEELEAIRRGVDRTESNHIYILSSIYLLDR